jgi:putative hemolysin
MVAEGEIRALIDTGREVGAVEPSEARLLENVFRFGDRQIREVMTPRPEIIALEKGAALETFLSVYQEHSHTRFPIFDGTVDNIIGTLSVKDVVRAMTAGEVGPEDDVTDVLRDAYFVPETKLVGQLFHELRQSGYQVVMVADEFGGLAGLVTLKQMVEEIVGRVSDEGVVESEEYQAIDANTFQADAGMRVEEANAQLALDIPEGEYETLAGFLLTRFGHIPREGEYVHHHGFQMQVVEMNGVRIEQVRMTRVARPEPEASQ